MENRETKLNRYYKFKALYETKTLSAKREIMKSELPLNKKLDKLKRYNDKRNVCMNCKNEGGNIFKNENGMLTVSCGNINPCDVGEKYNVASIQSENIRDRHNSIDSELMILKNRIVTTKLDYLFGFSTQEETLEQFNSTKNIIASKTEESKKTESIYKNVTEDKTNTEERKEMEKQRNDMIKEIKYYGNQIESSKNDDSLHSMIQINCELQKQMKDYLDLKYQVNDVIVDNSNMNVLLVQKPTDYNSLYVPASDETIGSSSSSPSS